MAKAAKKRANGALADTDPFWEVPKAAPKKKRKPRKPKVVSTGTALTVPALVIAPAPEPMVRRAALAVVGWFKRLSPLPRAPKAVKKRGRPAGSKDKAPRKRRVAAVQ